LTCSDCERKAAGAPLAKQAGTDPVYGCGLTNQGVDYRPYTRATR